MSYASPPSLVLDGFPFDDFCFWNNSPNSNVKLGEVPTDQDQPRFPPVDFTYTVTPAPAPEKPKPRSRGNDAAQVNQPTQVPRRAVAYSVSGPLDPRSHSCEACGNYFLSDSELSRHILVHKRPHQCSINGCTWAFFSTKDLARHKTSKHWGYLQATSPDIICKVYYCPMQGCDYMYRGFARKDNYFRHLRQVHGHDSGLIPTNSVSQNTFIASP